MNFSFKLLVAAAAFAASFAVGAQTIFLLTATAPERRLKTDGDEAVR